MPIDASIYSLMRPTPQPPGPLDQFGRVMQIKNLMGQGRIQDLQGQQLETGMQEEQKIRDLFSSGRRPTQEEVMAVSPARGMQYGKSLQEQNAALATALQKDDDLVKSFSQQSKQELLAVTTPQAWEQWKAAQLQRASLLTTPQYKQLATENLQKLPAQFDPNWIKATLSGATPAPAGHTRMPGGGLSPVDPNYLQGQVEIATAKRPQVTTNILPPQKTFENEDKLRADYSADPIVKSAKELSTAFGLIESAYQRPSAANDLAMATKYMKILDPTSVVRESEFALAVNATGLLDKVQNYAASILEGKKLNPAQRKDFYESAKAINEAFQAKRSEVDQQYADMATGYGLNPQNVIPSLRTKAKPKTAPTPAVPGKPKFLGFE